MTLHAVDVGIIVAYFVATILLGFWVSRRGARDLDSYFLGGKSLPWYLLGISDASGMFDITGTMWLVYVLFVYGLKSLWLPWLWPTFNQVFLMMFLSGWVRRSNVMTGAQWIETRFGRDRGASLAHLSVVLFALVNVVGMLAYAFIGIGKFAVVMLPWRFTEATSGLVTNENIYAVAILLVTSVYAIKGGMFSVVSTEVMQFTILTVTALSIGVVAITTVSPGMVLSQVPAGWTNPFFGLHLGLDWTGVFDKVNDAIRADGNELFAVVFGLMFFKGVLASLAGPAPNYDLQRVLATRNPREACLMNGMVNVVLYFPRYLMVAGLTAMAFAFCMPELRAMDRPDFEKLLPLVLTRAVPVGVLGLLLAGLLAAFMSNFAATVNAAPAYIVNDIYKRFIRPRLAAEDRRAPEPDRLGGRAPRRPLAGPPHDPHHRDHDVDRRRALRRLRRGERAQVVLVALQRLRLLLGHGGRDRQRDGGTGGARRRRRPRGERDLHDPVHPRPLDGGLPARHAAHRGRGRRGADELLPHGAPVGLLGADPREGDGRGPVVRPERRLR